MYNRRELLKGAFGLSTLPLLGVTARANPAQSGIFLQLHIGQGMNAAYMFDARPLSFTAAGKIQNFTKEETIPYTGKNGQSCYVSTLAKKLLDYKDYFSVLNGVQMAVDDNGHEGNINYALCGSNVPQENFHRWFSAPNSIFDVLQMPRLIDGTGSVFSSSGRAFMTTPSAITAFVGEELTLNFGPDGKSSTSAVKNNSEMISRIASEQIQRSKFKNDVKGGLLATASRKLADGVQNLKNVEAVLLKTKSLMLPTTGVIEESLELISAAYKAGLANCFVLVIGGNEEDIDFHNGEQAAKTTQMFYGNIFDRIAKTIDFLRTRSLLSSTTYMVTSEFNRTMRQQGKSIELTGTDHNQYGNSILIGGAGIKSGLVIGASDLDVIENGQFKNVSKAHLMRDPDLLSVIGKPFDFKAEKPTEKSHNEYNVFQASEYLNYGSIVNTLLTARKAPTSALWKVSTQENAAQFPILKSLIA